MATDLHSPPTEPAAADNRVEPFALPWKMLWLYAVGPLLLSPIVVPQFFSRPLGNVLSIVASFYVAFFGIGVVLHFAYAKLQPRRLQGDSRLSLRLVGHALFTASIIIPAALSLQPLYCMVNTGNPSAAAVNYCLYRITPVQRLEFLWTSMVIAWGCVLPSVMLHALRRDRDAIERRLQEERRSRLSAQLQALQSRLNPHFLFNSLNTIACLIHEDPVAAERVLERLAELLRYGLADADRTVVRLRDELSVVQAYLEVQAARFGERLRFSIDCPPALLEQQVPPLCLQPLVENAVLHGAVAQRRGGLVTVRVEVVDGQLCLGVQDDGPGPGNSSHQGSGSALSGLRGRLRILYPEANPPASLELQAAPNGPGCLVLLRLPHEDRPPT